LLVGGKPAPKIIRRTDVDVTITEFKKIDLPQAAAVSLALLAELSDPRHR
jgi:hypothetical protein